MPLCVSVEFLCLSVYQSVCLSKSLFTCICLQVCLSFCLSVCLSLSEALSLSLSLSLSICGVVLADQESRARYRAFLVFFWTLNQSFPFNL